MAITNPDGSIILDTKVDTTGINKGIASMRSSMTRLAATIGLAFSVTALVRFGKEAVKLASDLEEVQNVVDVSFGNMSYKIEEFSKTCIENFGLSELTAKQLSSTMLSMGKSMGQSLELGSDKAIELTGRLADVASFRNLAESDIATLGSAIYTGETEPLKRIGIMMTEANLQLFTMEKGYKTLYKDMDAANKLLVRQEYFLERTSDAAGDYIRTQDGWANQTRTLSERWKEVKIQFGETFKAVGTLVLPVINAVVKGLGYIAQLLQSLASGVYKLFTGQELFAKETETAKDQISGAVGEQEELTEEIENSKKAQDKFLAGFDDLQKASANMAESFEDAGLDTGFESSVPQLNLGEGNGTNELEKKKDDIIRILGEMGGYIAGALVAIGLILLVSGQIPWGLGFILAGAVTYEVSKVAEKSGYDTKAVTKALKDMTPTIAGALVAIGLILLFLAQIGWGVGFIIAGAGLYAVNEEAFGDSSIENDTITKLAIIGEAVSLALVSIGVILLLLGRLRWGLGFVIAGAGLLHVSEQQLGTTNITTEIQKFANENRKAIQKMGALLMVLGVLIIALSKAYFLKGMAVMLAGVALLYTETAIDPANEEVSNAITAFGEEHWDTIAETGGLLIALGILLMCTGDGLGHGLAMVIAGASLIYTAEELSGGAFTDFLNDLGMEIDNWFRERINSFIRYINKLIPGLELEEIPYVTDPFNGKEAIVTEGSGQHQAGDIQAERRKARLKAQAEQAERAEKLERIAQTVPDVFVPHSTVNLATTNTVQSLNPAYQLGTTMPAVILEVDGTELARSVNNANKDEAIRTGATLN